MNGYTIKRTAFGLRQIEDTLERIKDLPRGEWKASLFIRHLKETKIGERENVAIEIPEVVIE